MTIQTVRTVSTIIDGGRTLEVTQYADPDGTPTDLIVSVGWSHEPGWRNRGGAIALPATALPLLIDALARIGAS